MKIAYILLSNGLEYDDRIRKEMVSIREVLGAVEFKIFAFSGDDNHSGSGVLSYGVPYEFVSVAHRNNKKKDVVTLLRREYSFYSQVAKRVKDFDLLWCCDEQPFFFPLFSSKPVIWDLHEIPKPIIGSRLKNLLFHRMESRCQYLIHANQERLDYLKSIGVIKQPDKNLIIRNYPDLKWLAGRRDLSEGFQSFSNWLGNREYIYIQGISLIGRYPWETLSAIMESKSIKAVVVGNVDSEIKKRLAITYPNYEEFLFFAGQMIQSETAAFLANSKFSMVFYNDIKPNNRYCEPNRMFQSLGLGNPVIVGHNEPMRNIVQKYGNGIVLESDGRRVGEIVAAIDEMQKNYSRYKERALEHKDLFAWESQLPVFRKLFENHV